MTNPNDPFESRPENLSETTNPSTVPSSQRISDEQFNQVQQQASNIFNEIIDDINNKKDLDVILGMVAIVMAFVTLFVKASSSTIINIVLYSTPILSGWLLRAGYTAVGQNNKTKLLALGGISFGLFVVALYDTANALAGIRQVSDALRSIPRF